MGVVSSVRRRGKRSWFIRGAGGGGAVVRDSCDSQRMGAAGEEFFLKQNKSKDFLILIYSSAVPGTLLQVPGTVLVSTWYRYQVHLEYQVPGTGIYQVLVYQVFEFESKK